MIYLYLITNKDDAGFLSLHINTIGRCLTRVTEQVVPSTITDSNEVCVYVLPYEDAYNAPPLQIFGEAQYSVSRSAVLREWKSQLSLAWWNLMNTQEMRPAIARLTLSESQIFLTLSEAETGLIRPTSRI